MKKILGLDLGTNSIGWAVVNQENDGENSFLKSIEAAGSRIIPMSADIMGDFERGNSVSQTKDRTKFRATRRLRERFLLRRERLHRVLGIMGYLPSHYSEQIDKLGKFLPGTEPKLEWRKSDSGKYEFIFHNSFEEMLTQFRNNHNGKEIKNIPADWTIYYLRKKALTERISEEELAWILLNFNQKRGYYQLRGEDKEDDFSKKEEYMKLTVVGIDESDQLTGKEKWYNIHLSNGLVYKRKSDTPLDWIGKEKEFIITTHLENDGSIKKDKDGEPKISIRAPKEEDWTLVKKRTESDLENSGKTVGAFIYDSILENPNIKILGNLVRTIERRYYKDELRQIIRKQMEFHLSLNNKELYAQCVNELYPNNESYRNSILGKDFEYLLLDDILFYQRPLKSKKHLISNCPYEKTKYINPKTGETSYAPIKCIAKSHPLFQEFRLWQFISNLRVLENDGDNKDVTSEFFKSNNDWYKLYKWLNEEKEVDQSKFLSKFLKIDKIGEIYPYRWNYVEDKKYPCNTTKYVIASKLQNEADKLSPELLLQIWHLLYSVRTKEEIDAVFSDDKKGKNTIYDKLLESFTPEKIHKLKSIKFEEDDYGSYSEKAIKKLLPLMRLGPAWSYDKIDSQTKERIEKLLYGIDDVNIDEKIRDKVSAYTTEDAYQGLPLWLACYVVYGRHSEGSDSNKWNNPEEIEVFLNNFRQHSLNNPIVEQVVTETLRTVKDIWVKVGKIDEIHIELGRDLKKTKDERKEDTKRITNNENTNHRIRTLLYEFLNPEYDISGVRPYSPTQIDLLKIYEEGVLNSNAIKEDGIDEIISKLSSVDSSKQATKSEIMRYKIWLDQKYCSPYTGQPIPLSKLFTAEYEIEHIIPQSRYFDDSLSNKVICESEVNKLKDRLLGLEFIEKYHGSIVTLSGGRNVKIFEVDAYLDFIKKTFQLKNRKKYEKLLLTDIPDKFIERQMNDTRYISKYIMSLLSNIVREEVSPGVYEAESTSKNLIACTGKITDRLKQDWGANDIWNSIILPRFERLNNLLGVDTFTATNNCGHTIPNMPNEYLRGFNKKRIDHRHHAMDAIIIACTTRSHVHLLNNIAAKSENRHLRAALSHKLRRYETEVINGMERSVAKEFIKPWPTFTQDLKTALEDIIISFKQNLRVINKATNKYLSYYDKEHNLRLDASGKPIKAMISQHSNPNWWAIRKSLHKDTVYGKVNLRKVKEVRLSIAIQNPKLIVDKELKVEIKKLLNLGYDEKKIKKYFKEGENIDIWADFNPNKIKVYYFTDDTYATRKSIDESFTKSKILSSVTDTGIQKILLRHLEENNDDPKIAFGPDGIDRMNANIEALNNGTQHKPIRKVRCYEAGSKFAIGSTGNKKDKFVEADKGTNLYFAIYSDTEGNRVFETVPLNEVIDRLKQGMSPVPESNSDDFKLLFYLSPNDLVYVPTDEEIREGNVKLLKDRIYKMVSSSGPQCHFVYSRVAVVIINKGEFSPLNKMERAISGEMIKEVCIPIKVNRLGEIKYVGTEFLPKGNLK